MAVSISAYVHTYRVCVYVLTRGYATQAARLALERGRHVPTPHTIKETLKDKEAVAKIAAESRAWVQKGMKEDAEKVGVKI